MTYGANKHHSTPAFQHINKLLTAYAILKPPKYGHFIVDKQATNTNLIKISDLRSIYNSFEPAAVQKSQNKLDGFVQEGEWEFSDVC